MSKHNGTSNPEDTRMQLAEALADAPAPISATSLDPYGQLVKMLMPRAQSIAIYDRLGLPVWLNDGLDAPELHRLLQDALAQELGDGSHEDGFTEPVDRDHSAYVFLLRDANRQLLGAVGIICRESSQRGDGRPFSLVQGLLRPALECLQRDLLAQYSMRDLQRSLGVSYLFITHNIGVVEYIADQVAVMRAGRIEEQGPCDRVLSRPAHDYTRSLLASVPRLVVG